MTTLDVTAITDFILAAEAFFLAGLLWARPKMPRTAAWYWQFALIALAVSAFLGGLDHGFFERAGDPHARRAAQLATWIVIGVLTASILLATAAHFLSAAQLRIARTIAGIQFIAFVIAIHFVTSFFIVIVNYAPVVLWAFWCNIRGLRDGSGTWSMTAGIGLAILASVLQATGIDLTATLDHNGLYHLGMMASLVYLYLGGLRLKS